jgi:hypothetical protein
MILAATMRGLTIIKGQLFPRRQKCSDAVLFEFVRSAPDLYQHASYSLYVLPISEENWNSVIGPLSSE